MRNPNQQAQTNPRAAAIEALADAVRKVSDALHLLAVAGEVTLIGAPGPRLVTGREPEVLLTMAEACALFPGRGSRESSIFRLARQHPEIARRIGRRTWYERGALLRVTRRTA